MQKINKPILVINCDLVTKVNYENLINYHNWHSNNCNYKNNYQDTFLKEEEEFEFNQDQQFDKIKSINSVQDIVDNKLNIDDLEILVRDKIENNQEEELAQFIHDLIYQS